ncbi:MAG: hypothetical protein P4L31_06090 [Candidatus Babeliales bacterium]|nr:hypothetical protein [Candidatus Babeliales bacterium]
MTKKMLQQIALMLFAGLSSTSSQSSIEYITSETIITPELSSGAIIRQEPGFETDFLVLHCLVKKFNPKNLFEIGTCQGYGTLIMANACPSCSIISLELPPYTPPYSMAPSDIGYKCRRPYKQIYGNSMSYDYTQHFPVDAWFIDGAHDYKHVEHETKQAAKSGAKLIIYHDTDIEEVLQAVIDGLAGTEYKLYRITDTRVSYAVKQNAISLE